MINKIQHSFELFANEEKADQMFAYMKGHFKFYGVPSPKRKEIFNDYRSVLKDLSIDQILALSKQLWSLPQRELHYFAMDSLDLFKKKLSYTNLDFGEFLILNYSWWDTVDYLSTHYFAPILIKMSEKERYDYIFFLAKHSNMWMNRVGIIFQLARKLDTQTELLELAIIPHLESKEFFHQKAIGWALRQYSKYNPLYVKEFVESNPLQKLSIREASKYLLKD